MAINGSSKHWSAQAALEFYSTSRCRIGDLYDSEKVFLPRMLRRSMKVLDAGCAAGGFYNIMKEIEPSILYYGCDFTEALVRKAKKNYSQAEFLVADLVRLPFCDNCFDLVNCAGTCHMIPHYFKAIRQIYRVSRRFSIFDVRLTDETIDFGTSRCYQKLSFNNVGWDGLSISPYVILNARDFLRQLLNGLSPKPRSIYATGYLRAPADTVITGLQQLCMAVFMIEKADDGYKGRTEICMDIPYDYMRDEEFCGEAWLEPSRLYTRLRQR